MNKQRELTEAGEFLAEEPDIFARCPGVDNVRSTAVRENTLPIAIDSIESVHGIILFAQFEAAIRVFRNGDGGGMAESGELVREIVDVDGAVGAEVVVKNEEDVAHGRRGL
jgi:hypothetical protein